MGLACLTDITLTLPLSAHVKFSRRYSLKIEPLDWLKAGTRQEELFTRQKYESNEKSVDENFFGEKLTERPVNS